MALTTTTRDQFDCPENDEVRFATLGEVNRLGAAFCAKPFALELLDNVQGYRTFRMQCLATTMRILHACRPPARSVVSVRLKRLDSICRKLARRGANFKLGTLDDIIGVRVIAQSVSDVIALSARIGSSSHIHRVKNYIKTPAETGYRSIHHIMRFDQRVAENHFLTVRYEIQVRTCLQHRWAVWSESYGEKAKIGQADAAHHSELRNVALDIARWEDENPERIQEELLSYSDVGTIAVCWTPTRGPATILPFHNDVRAAVAWLNHLEVVYSSQRENALLLVGVAEHADMERALRLTHPLYAGARVVHPRFYIPSTSP